MMLAVIKWLSDPSADIAEGIALYAIHGRNRHLLQQFRKRKVTAWTREKLTYELSKIAPAKKIVTQTVTELGSEQSWSSPEEIGTEIPLVWNEEGKYLDLAFPSIPAPETSEDALAIEKSRLFGERAKLSNSLHKFALGDDAGRKAVVDQIKAITRQMNTIRLQQAGEIEQEIVSPVIKFNELPTELGALYQERNNLRTRQTKGKRQLSQYDQGSVGWLKYTKKLEAIEERLQEVEGRLK
jgi:hypothetical protein